MIEQSGKVRLQICHYATPVGGENAARVCDVYDIVRHAPGGGRGRRSLRRGLQGTRKKLIESVNGRAVSAFEGNTHTAVDDSRDQNGDFEFRYPAFHLREELHDQLIVALQGLVTDDNAATGGTLDSKKESANAKVVDPTRTARAALDADLGLYLQSLSYVATSVVT